jgi:xylulokinase
MDVSGGEHRVATVSRYPVDRYGFEPGKFAIVDSYLNRLKTLQLRHLLPTTYQRTSRRSLLPPMPYSRSIPWIFFSQVLRITSPVAFTSVYPHPAQDPSEKRKYISKFTHQQERCRLIDLLPIFSHRSQNADVPRALVRDMYSQSRGARSTALYPSFHQVLLLGLSRQYLLFGPSFTHLPL